MAIENNNLEIIQLLLNSGKINVNALTILYIYILFHLSSNNKMVFMNFSFYKTPLYLAIENGNLDIVKLLLTINDIDVNAIFL